MPGMLWFSNGRIEAFYRTKVTEYLGVGMVQRWCKDGGVEREEM